MTESQLRMPLPPTSAPKTPTGAISATRLPRIDINEIDPYDFKEQRTRDPFEYDRSDLRMRGNWDLP